ncbi:MAG: hypothetical protein PHE51_09690 [Eubacteriales bacterium]|nr:hypothetical protein [Eubacteriales bacterium]
MAGEITGETIKSSVSLTIKELFKVSVGTPPVITYPKIYKEQVIEKASLPYFFVWILNEDTQKQRNNKYELTYQMKIEYHPIDKLVGTYEACSAIAHSLFEGVEYISVPIFLGHYTTPQIGDPVQIVEYLPVKGKQMNWIIQDDILCFFVTYTIQATKVLAVIAKMATVKQNYI